MTPVKIITDEESGRKWEIFKKSEDQYFYKYYEYFKSIGWHFTGREGDHEKGYITKDIIQWQFDIAVI